MYFYPGMLLLLGFSITSPPSSDACGALAREMESFTLGDNMVHLRSGQILILYESCDEVSYLYLIVCFVPIDPCPETSAHHNTFYRYYNIEASTEVSLGTFCAATRPCFEHPHPIHLRCFCLLDPAYRLPVIYCGSTNNTFCRSARTKKASSGRSRNSYKKWHEYHQQCTTP